MGIEMPKSRKVSCSNWASRSLNMQQIKYACLDVFVAGQVSTGTGCMHQERADKVSAGQRTCLWQAR